MYQPSRGDKFLTNYLRLTQVSQNSLKLHGRGRVVRSNAKMSEKDLFFVIPTNRLRDVGETVQHYDEHFWLNGHSVRMIVFDDSSPSNHAKYYSLLEQASTHN